MKEAAYGEALLTLLRFLLALLQLVHVVQLLVAASAVLRLEAALQQVACTLQIGNLAIVEHLLEELRKHSSLIHGESWDPLHRLQKGRVFRLHFHRIILLWRTLARLCGITTNLLSKVI